MLSRLLHEARPEQLINWGRFTTSSFALLAVFLDPTQPTKDVSDIYVILGVYVAFSLLVMLIPSRDIGSPVHAASTGIDIAVLGVLAIISEELESPFFIFFTFTLITATIRWSWRGVLTTACLLQALLLLVGVPDLETGDYELNVLIIRSVFCWVVAVMLGYFSGYRSRNEARLRDLADWPNDLVPEDGRPWLSSALSHATSILGTRRLVILWQEVDGGGLRLAWWSGSECRYEDGIRLDDADLIPGRASDPPSEDRGRQLLLTLQRLAEAGSPAFRDGILHPGARKVHVEPFASIRYRGSVIVIDPAFQEEHVAALARIVASRIALQLEQFSLVNDFSAAASMKERMRLARDLHDSVLQDLTAAVLQLEGASRGAPQPTGEAMMRIGELLKAQQRRMRSYVTETRFREHRTCLLTDQLRAIAEPLQLQWGCRVQVSVSPADLSINEVLAAELCLVLSEATANAVRHGKAGCVSADLRVDGPVLRVLIDNDGSLAAPGAPAVPRSLNRRMAELGGRLMVAQQSARFALAMEIPLDRGAA